MNDAPWHLIRRLEEREDELTAEVKSLRAELEKERDRFRPGVGFGAAIRIDRTPALVTLPRNALDFLATLVGGTGDFVWGEIAKHFELDSSDIDDVFNILTAAAHDARCVSCGADLVRQGVGWVHGAGPGCDALIVPEHLQ